MCISEVPSGHLGGDFIRRACFLSGITAALKCLILSYQQSGATECLEKREFSFPSISWQIGMLGAQVRTEKILVCVCTGTLARRQCVITTSKQPDTTSKQQIQEQKQPRKMLLQISISSHPAHPTVSRYSGCVWRETGRKSNVN